MDATVIVLSVTPGAVDAAAQGLVLFLMAVLAPPPEFVPEEDPLAEEALPLDTASPDAVSVALETAASAAEPELPDPVLSEPEPRLAIAARCSSVQREPQADVATSATNAMPTNTLDGLFTGTPRCRSATAGQFITTSKFRNCNDVLPRR